MINQSSLHDFENNSVTKNFITKLRHINNKIIHYIITSLNNDVETSQDNTVVLTELINYAQASLAILESDPSTEVTLGENFQKIRECFINNSEKFNNIKKTQFKTLLNSAIDFGNEITLVGPNYANDPVVKSFLTQLDVFHKNYKEFFEGTSSKEIDYFNELTKFISNAP